MLGNYGTNTNTLLLFHGNNGYANVPQCYLIRTSSVLSSDLSTSSSSPPPAYIIRQLTVMRTDHHLRAIYVSLVTPSISQFVGSPKHQMCWVRPAIYAAHHSIASASNNCSFVRRGGFNKVADNALFNENSHPQ